MAKSYKPEAHNAVSPYLLVNGASKTIEFLKEVFDGVELMRHPEGEREIHHAEVRIQDSVVMLADAEGPGSHVHIYVPDVDATYARALKAGATSVQAPIKKQDSDKRGAVKDAGGTTWWIGTRVE
jgi:PhnB protein